MLRVPGAKISNLKFEIGDQRPAQQPAGSSPCDFLTLQPFNAIPAHTQLNPSPPAGSPSTTPAWGFSLDDAALVALALLIGLLGTGCATEGFSVKALSDKIPFDNPFSDQPRDRVTGPSYRPTNVHVHPSDRLAQVRRVVLLPMTLSDLASTSAAGRDTLQPLLLSELGQTKHFEVIQLTSAQLKQWTGRAEWTAEDPIPPDALGRMREETAADAVLFARLTQFRAYQPLAVGWSLKLVSLTDARILWAVDEVFDAGEPTVVNAARRYYLEHQRDNTALGDSRAILNSPRRFGRYAAHATFASLPPR